MPSMRTPSVPSLARMALRAGGVRTWLQNTEKLPSPSARAWRRATAVGGVVVSKPMAKKTTCLAGSARAMASASWVE